MLVFGTMPMMGAFATTEESNVSYVFANDFTANADGVIKYTGDLSADEITAAKLYWADSDGKKLDGYLAIAEIDGATAIAGYAITDSKLIPKGAMKLLMEITTDSESVEELFDIPLNKQNSGDDIYSMVFVSDSHFNADEVNNTYMNKASMITRFNTIKNFMNGLSEAGDNVIGLSLIGDVVVGEHTESSGHGVWEALKADYDLVDAVLSETAFESSYPIYFINGNHDIIYSENGDGSAWINFLDQKIADYNTAVENNVYAENIMSAILPINKENGKYWYDTYVNGYHYIYLSVPYNGFGIYSEEQLAWLDGLLAEDAKQSNPTFVFGHYPLSYTHENSAGHFDNSVELEKVLAKYPNTIYISGHTHTSPEVNTAQVIIGDNKTTTVNTGALITYLTDADGNRIYTPTGIYCKVFADRVEFQARVFCNLNDGSEGYWVSKTSKVLTLKNTANKNIDVKITSNRDNIRNGTTLTATIGGKAVDTTKYECKWYVDNTLVDRKSVV